MRLEPQFMKDFSSGMISNLNVNLAPQNSVDMSVNLVYDEELGSAVSRLGLGAIGSQLVDNNAILGLHQHIDTANASNNILLATINASGGATSVVYNVTAGSTVITGLTASKKMRFLTYLSATLAINGANAERSYTQAGGWITTGGAFDLANIPSSNTVKYCTEFLDRVYVAGDTAQPSRLYYSGISSGTAVSWTSGNGYVDIEAEDGGGGITALGKVPGYILVFKERSMHRWNFSSAFPESLVQIGTPSQESVVMGGGLCAFYSNSNENAKGFYITNGGRPVCISQDNTRPIKKWVEAIAGAFEDDVAGWATDRGFAWSVGDLTVDGETYNNVVLKYNRILNQWSMHTYPSEFRFFANYLVSSVNTTVGGDDDGTVFQLDKPATYADGSTSIKWKLRTNHSHYGFNQLKSIQEQVIVRGKNLEGASLKAIIDEDIDKAISIGGTSWWRRLLSVFGVGNTIEGTTISIEVSGENSGNRAYVREIEVPAIDVRNNYT